MSIKARPVKGTVRLNNNYNNVIKFKDNAEKFAYLEQVEEGFTYYLGQSPDMNFNIGDTINTSITLDYGNWGDDLNSALNRNYLVVADSNFALNYYFYFIVGATPLNRGLVQYNLELDVFTTYTINKDYEIDDFLVARAHQDRWDDEATAKSAAFNLTETAPAQLSDSAEALASSKFPKRIIDVEYGRQWCESDAAFELFKKIEGWVYMYTTKSSGSKTPYSQKWLTANELKNSLVGTIEIGYNTYIAPLSDQIIQCKWGSADVDFFYWSQSFAREHFETSTTESPVSYMIGKTCPFLEGIDVVVFKISAGGLLYFDSVAYSDALTSKGYASPISTEVVKIFGGTVKMEYINLSTLNTESNQLSLEDLGLKTAFYNLSKNDMVNIEKEPKILKKGVTEIALKNNEAEEFVTGAFEIGDSFRIKSVESISPASSTLFSTFVGDDSFSTNYFEASVGLTSFGVLDLPIVNNTYAEYMRSNKNAAITGAVIPTAQTLAGGTGQAITGAGFGKGITSPGTAGLGVAGASAIGGAAISGAINIAAGLANYHYEMDNLKSTPNTIRGFSNNTLFGLSKKGDYKNVVVVNSAKPEDVLTFAEYLYKYGYSLQQRRNSTELFGRYIFNYVQAMDSTADKIKTNVPMSNIIKDTIENVLKKGVTFWNADSGKLFNYTYENYESRLFAEEDN